jgi:hypothetical protein
MPEVVSAAAIAAFAIVGGGLLTVAFGPDVLALIRRRRQGSGHGEILIRDVRDPGRELRAERRAEQLLRSVLGEADYEAYRALGFLHVYGGREEDGEPSYGYLIYPHKPLVSYDVRTGRLLSEYCVSFPDRSGATPPGFGERLPDADDVLAKWMALRADERGLINVANMHLPGRQLDPDHVRRDLVRLSEWTGRTSPTRAET